VSQAIVDVHSVAATNLGLQVRRYGDLCPTFAPNTPPKPTPAPACSWLDFGALHRTIKSGSLCADAHPVSTYVRCKSRWGRSRVLWQAGAVWIAVRCG